MTMDGSPLVADLLTKPYPEEQTMTAKMPTFTPADSALLLIDHQTGTMQLIKNIPLDVAKRNTLALAKRQRRS
jgi:hypothetical protein